MMQKHFFWKTWIVYTFLKMMFFHG